MPKKKIQLILNSNLKHLGASGDIIQVSQGYARNYLIPKSIAEPVTQGRLNYIRKCKDKEDLINQEKRKFALDVKSQLEAIYKFSIKRKVSDNNNIFGSITDKDIVDTISKITGIKLEKSYIKLPIIKTVGLYDIEINLMTNIAISLKLQILPETT
uniref:Large ribosomal subunit protein bL9c n=1 Tax=Helminthora furcellata TaxID=1884666 RepID=A0A1G4NZH5_9FLOR|nr:Ribosomal protein L9 [Helminthora furcellata]SCW21223.1 Ribosomal protein L9 [Helminthora furcellata]SCW24083.1 Ribosomal protein L9 [Helminthora furcellata]